MKQLEANGEKKILPAFLYGPELTSPTSKLALYSSVTVIVEESVIYFFSFIFAYIVLHYSLQRRTCSLFYRVTQ